jgi:hypothetical protein
MDRLENGESGMHLVQKFSALLILFGLALALLLLPQPSASSANMPSTAAPQSASEDAVPAFHTQPPQDALPATMSPDTFSDPVVQNAYTVAARIKKVLYQEPCYCHCDRTEGHGSLLDCFVSKHGSGCEICVREDLYSYEQSRKGKSAAQIRAGIIRGEWQSMDVSKYQNPLPAAHK